MTVHHTTNLPPLPAGYFWRVSVEKDGYNLESYISVQLRRERWFGSSEMYGLLLDLYDNNRDCRSIVKKAAEQLYAVYSRQRAAKELTGDYPPKRL